jgi:hypothetical protein
MIAPAGTRWTAAAKTAVRVLEKREALIDMMNAVLKKEHDKKKRERIMYLLQRLTSPDFIVKAAIFAKVNSVVCKCIQELEKDEIQSVQLRETIDKYLQELDDVNNKQKTWIAASRAGVLRVAAKAGGEGEENRLRGMGEKYTRLYVDRVKDKIDKRFDNIGVQKAFNVFNPKEMRKACHSTASAQAQQPPPSKTDGSEGCVFHGSLCMRM